MTRVTRRALVIAAALAAAGLWPAAASAHPLGNFTINLYSGLHVRSGHVVVDYAIDMAEIPTHQELATIDTNGDGRESLSEKAAWARAEAPRILPNLSLTVNGSPLALSPTCTSMTFRPGQAGLPILRFAGTFEGKLPPTGTLTYRDANYAGHIGWREITAVGEDGATLTTSSVPDHSVSDTLLHYPLAMLSSPLRVTSATVTFGPGSSGSSATAFCGTNGAVGARPGVTGGAFANLVSRAGLTPLWFVLSLLLAFAFGAIHAIGPGHGKTLMAAYLVGTGGRAQQAIAVGASVAVMHTASVLALGVLILQLTSAFAPERVYPWLGIASGLVAIGLGAALLVSRLGAWADFRSSQGATGEAPRHHAQGELEEHDHGPDLEIRHEGHAHLVPDAPVLSRKGLLALAFAGGILPSPTALIVLLSAVSFHRVAFGLALIAAFSIGLAAALIAVGLTALRARTLVSRRMSTRWAHLLPVASAALIVAFGAFLAIRGATQL